MIQKSLAEPGKTHYRTIFLSDIHLGTRGCQADRLLDFLKNHTCDRLYLVGDIVDGWRMKSQLFWPQSHTNVLRRFLTLTKRGTEVIYVTGNHDEFLRGFAGLMLGGIALKNEAVHRTADGRELLVTHGDQFDACVRNRRWLALLGDRAYEACQKLNVVLNALRKPLGYGHWSLADYLKRRVKNAISYVGSYELAAASEARRRGFDGIVCGHIHHPALRTLEGLAYCNTGDWVDSCTALVEDAHGRLSLLSFADAPEPAATQVRVAEATA